MPIRDKWCGGSPGQELKNFTGRDDELARFERLLALEEPTQIPVLMFYGVGGTGKSWLLKASAKGSQEVRLSPRPTSTSTGDQGARPTRATSPTCSQKSGGELDVECPRFETAYGWMRFKQGAGERPLVRHSGKISSVWEFVKEGQRRSELDPGLQPDRLGDRQVREGLDRQAGKNLYGPALAEPRRSGRLHPPRPQDRPGDLYKPH